MKPTLITGARGNVGREVVRACRAADVPIRLTGGDEAPLDFTDRSTWRPALAGCGQVFLLRPPPISDMNATLNPFVDLAYELGIAHVTFLSVAGAETKSWVPHRKVELHLEAAGRGYTILRPGFFAQNLQDAYRRDIVEDRRLYVPAGSGRVAFLDVHDVGDVAARVFAAPGEFQAAALTLTGSEAVTFGECAALLSAALGHEIAYEAASIPGYAWHLHHHRRMNAIQIAVQTILHVGLRRGDAESVDPTIPRLLGRPARSIRQYIAESAAVWQLPVAPATSS